MTLRARQQQTREVKLGLNITPHPVLSASLIPLTETLKLENGLRDCIASLGLHDRDNNYNASHRPAHTPLNEGVSSQLKLHKKCLADAQPHGSRGQVPVVDLTTLHYDVQISAIAEDHKTRRRSMSH
ncbi:unnamed protein product [Lactuca saligna]|uniref:Uncharacterized protein n=1 Tax=Lactuca saligna TaxID=75948 RepID=A0AA35Z308_LACSI|nr:unnamed protein product [Lactuca saligna]